MSESPEKTFALEVVEKLRQAGFEALWAGGCVRDLMMGHAPSDYDVATSATPQEVRELFGHRRTLPVGVAFGVVIVLSPRRVGVQIEVATFRTDANYSDGRRPDAVTFSTAREDALRRDFTINGMFFDPVDQRVIDYVGGTEDLREQIVRAIGRADERIAEDKLRMLRAIRFAARFGFEIEAETRRAVAMAASQVTVVSGERIAVEIQKTLATPRAAWAVGEWESLALLREILPEVSSTWEENDAICQQLLDAIPAAPWQSKLSVLLYQANIETADQISEKVRSLKSRLKLSNADSTTIDFAVSAQETLANAKDLPWSRVQPTLIHDHIQTGLDLLTARLAIGQVEASCLDFLRSRLALPPQQISPKPLLAGADLITLGARPGPEFKRLLDRAWAMQLDQQLTDREQALRWAAAVLQKEG